MVQRKQPVLASFISSSDDRRIETFQAQKVQLLREKWNFEVRPMALVVIRPQCSHINNSFPELFAY